MSAGSAKTSLQARIQGRIQARTQAILRPLRGMALRLSAALTGGALGGLASSGAAYGLCRLLLEQHVGLDTTLWPGWEWLVRSCAYGAAGGVLLLPPLLRQSATFKGLMLSLLPSMLMLAGVAPQPHTEPAPFVQNEIILAVVPGANAAWGVVACWWMRLCGER